MYYVWGMRETPAERSLYYIFELPDKKGTLISHLPHDIENENDAVIAASNRQEWKKRFKKRQDYVFEFISVTNTIV